MTTSSTPARRRSASLTCTQILSPPVRQIRTQRYVPASSTLQNVVPNDRTSNNNDSTTTSPTTALSYTVRQPAWECAFSADGQYLAVALGAPDPVIRIYHYHHQTPQTPHNQHQPPSWMYQTTLSGIHEKTIRSVAFAPLINSPLVILASASFDGTVAIWEHTTNNSNNSKSKSKSGNSHDDNNNDDDWISTAQLEGHDTEVKCVRWNATGSLLATCGRDKSVWIWECYLPGTIGSDGMEPGEFECLAVLNGHEGDVKCVRFAPSHGTWGDGDEIVLSASYDTTIKCWAEDGGDWFCAATLQNAAARTFWTMSLSPSGGRLVAGDDQGTVSIYKCYTNQEKKQQQIIGERHDKNYNDDELGFWKCVGDLPGAHGDCPVYSVDYAPSAAGHGRLVTGGADQCLQILREESASNSDRPRFSTEVSVNTNTLENGSGGADILSVAWHPLDGSMLASAGDDGSVRIWKYQQS